MPVRSQEFINGVIESIIEYQSNELLSDRELSIMAGMSPTMVSKIKSGKTLPKLSTIRKLRDIGVDIKKPGPKIIEEIKQIQEMKKQID